MVKSNEYRARAEECQGKAATAQNPIFKQNWLKVAAYWLSLIPPTDRSAEQFEAVEREHMNGVEAPQQ